MIKICSKCREEKEPLWRKDNLNKWLNLKRKLNDNGLSS